MSSQLATLLLQDPVDAFQVATKAHMLGKENRYRPSDLVGIVIGELALGNLDEAEDNLHRLEEFAEKPAEYEYLAGAIDLAVAQTVRGQLPEFHLRSVAGFQLKPRVAGAIGHLMAAVSLNPNDQEAAQLLDEAFEVGRMVGLGPNL